MNASDRRKQNKANAQASTGPRTSSGKSASRANALTHGLTAKVLALPVEGESAEEIQKAADDWFQTLHPVGTDQIQEANFIALSSLKVERYNKAENAIVADQVRNAELQWDLGFENKLNDLKQTLVKKPAKTAVALKSFGKGVLWMLGEWLTLSETFDRRGCWPHFELIRHAMRLQGIDPSNMVFDNDAQEFLTRAVACVDDPEKKAKMRDFLTREGVIGYRYQECFEDWKTYDRDESIARIRELMNEQIQLLMHLSAYLRGTEEASREEARVRAMVPANTPQNTLLHRYARTAMTELDRALKTMIKLKEKGLFGSENEVETTPEAVLEEPVRNEPDLVAHATAKPVHPGSYIIINDKRYEVWETKDDTITLAYQCDDPMWRCGVKPKADPTVVSEPEKGV